jgi:acylpyruvate hydrolase
MRYVNYLLDGRMRIGEVLDDSVVPLDAPAPLGPNSSPEALAGARRITAEASPLSKVRLPPLVQNSAKILCVGLNYRSHVEETGRELPTYPVLFPKFASSLIGPRDDIEIPAESHQVDYEGELAVVIGRPGRRIPREQALQHVLGYTVANDVTMRDYQYKTHQWLQGKAWDRSTPLGPWLVTPDELDLSRAAITTTLNGTTVQSSDLSRLIFPVDELIATISEFTALEPGDVILTGTPSGVGYRREPQLFLTPGDVVTVAIDGIGELTSSVRAENVRSGEAGPA